MFTNIMQLIELGLNVFSAVHQMFKHPTTPISVDHAQTISDMATQAPGLTQDQKNVISLAVKTAATVAAATATPVK